MAGELGRNWEVVPKRPRVGTRGRKLDGTFRSASSMVWSVSYCPAVSTLRDAALWLAKTSQERFCRSTISSGRSLVRT